ncbi:RAN GTPase-activating protein 2-like protein [Carex littledalei]|uniref:RAN GTPase-activating protein 2-like protein n=1 Tax=Carex littledalei TaxID=544730 RepID=A0A833VSL8_9POAL|nr:RAN GTPase-activating protein 2-like protein [Carex littledalei]
MAEEIAPRSFSIKLWPPSDNTRQVIAERMTKNLSTETFFSTKYRLFSKEEAHREAVRIEETGFKVASELFMKEPDGDGSSAVQFYAKETSRLMIETLKRGPTEVPQVEIETTREVETEVKREMETDALPAENGTRREGAVFDISGGKRAFIEADETRELLSPLGQTSNWYTKIVFSNRSFGTEAARVAGPILESIKNQLLDVDLSDFVAGRPEEEALEVMRIFSLALEGSILRYLNLSDNAMGEKGVRAFEALLSSQKELEELYLMNDGISEEAAKALSELIPSTDKLKVLLFHNNMTGDEGAVAISEVVKKSPLLENFRCSSTRVGQEGGVTLAEALGACVNMKKLDLRDNLFGVEAGLALSKTITKLTSLKEIYLSYLNLEDEGSKEILNVLKSAVPGLEVLELAGNEITAAAAPVVVALLAATQNLKKLGLSENELKDEGAIVIAKALEGQTGLKELDLSSNLIQRAGARALANAVVNKEGFELLNINSNAISDEGLDEVKEIFKGSDVLGPLDENDVDLLDEEDEEGEEGDEVDLESKLGNLNVESED